jgi:hypothetical protein
MTWTAAATLTVTLLSGCAAQLGGSRGRVREIQAEGASKCKFLGVVESVDRSGWSMSDDQLGAMNEIRRRVAVMGGNAYVVTRGTSNSYVPVTQADVYRCR